MSRPGSMFVVLLGFLATARSQEVVGQATKLNGDAVRNVTIEVLSSRGQPLLSEFADDGAYNFDLPRRPDNDRGVIVRFSSPGQVTVDVTLNARRNHSFDVVMPIKQRRCCCCYCRQR